ncbi:MAG: hypothetical protein AAGA88_10375 [Pseudomonadota bacterium]
MTSAKKSEKDADRRAEADAILRRVADQSETIGSSSTKRIAERTRDHFMGADAPKDDPMEQWGRRIGRGLSMLFLFALLFYLVTTYL